MDDPTPNPTTRMETPDPANLPPPPPVPPAGSPSGWDQPYRARRHDGGGRTWSLLGGAILLGLGLWFFADKTLGLDLPDLSWSQLWPILLIGLGLVVLFGAMRRDRH
jgi:hypothetical protein